MSDISAAIVEIRTLCGWINIFIVRLYSTYTNGIARMDVLGVVGSIGSVVAIILVYIFRNSAQKYVDEKAKNLATIEDIAKITTEVEKVKTAYLQQAHAWKQNFEVEYALLREVWNSTWEFQATARSLRPLFDRLPEEKDKQREVFIERHKVFVNSVNSFRDMVIKNQPFIPPRVYAICLSLRQVVVEIQVDFEMSFDDSRPDWKKIHECGKRLDEILEELNYAIREYVHGKTVCCILPT